MVNDCLQFHTHLLGSLLQVRVVDGLHGCNGIDRGNLDLPGAQILDNDVARQHCANLVLNLERLMRQLRISGTQNSIGAEIDTDLVLECVLDVDLGDSMRTVETVGSDQRSVR